MKTPLLTSICALVLSGCVAGDLGGGTPNSSPNGNENGNADGNANTSSALPVTLTKNDKVDFLFMIDNSSSMRPKQEAFKSVLPGFIATLTSGRAASYHIGVVTSDVGAGTLNQSGCLGRGDGARLQAIGKAADPTCLAPVGMPFVQYDLTNGTNNLPAGQSLETTFGCMASVGDSGCGFEHSLESVRRALSDTPENQGFLRDDALLVVIFLTDEDDCSADPTTDLFFPGKTAEYGEMNSFRCARFGYICDEGTLPYSSSTGSLTNCRPASAAEGGKLIPIDRYVDFFTKSKSEGGIKTDPNQVVLATFSAPTDSISVRQVKSAATVAEQTSCDGQAVGPMCIVAIAQSCEAAGNPEFRGYPAVRIEALVRQAAQHQIASVCASDYAPALESLARRVLATREGGCVPGEAADATMSCAVTVKATGATLPACDGTTFPCWKLAASNDCTSGERLEIEEEGSAPQPGLLYEARCVRP